MFLRLIARLRRFRRREDGNPTVEFVLIFPIFMVLMVSAFESGLLMVRQMMLERGLDLSVRAVRLGTGDMIENDELRRMICNTTGIIPDCMSQVKVEMIRLDPRAFDRPDPAPDCVNRDEAAQVNRTFQNGQNHELMVLRVCALFDPIFPNFGLGVRLKEQRGDHYALVSTSVFVMEPG
ncbi:TadE/TadG family type IV pilus assembly protein [Roseisalinus antarcticus]|nr:TadE family protein [Roseisalinus antarcticus]